MKKNIIFMIISALSNSTNFCSDNNIANQNSKKIVIIGAGIAGLTTAYSLCKKGFDVHVYEARSRVGGRILSALICGNIAELGGENIADGGSYDNMRFLIEELGLKLFHSSTTFDDTYLHDNKMISVAELIKKHNFNLETLKKQLDAFEDNCSSMREVLDKLFEPNDPLKACLSTRLAGYEGASVDQLSSSYVETLYYMIQNGTCAAHKSNETSFVRIDEGNSKLPEALAKKLGDRVHLEMPLVEIGKHKEDQYVLTFKDGSRTTADILVLAIPCPVYNDIVFDKNVIPEEKLKAIRTIRNGDTAKIIVPISGSFNTSNVLINDYFGVFTYVDKIITLYFTGQSSRFLPETILQTYVNAKSLLSYGFIQSALPQQEPKVATDESFVKYSGPVGYSWPNDPFAKGSYSYIAAGQEKVFTNLEKIEGIAVKTLFAPIDDKLYFAGEHASTLLDIPGTMESACQSGNLAAEMIEKSVLKN